MGVSQNCGTPKSSILIGISIINHPFWGTPIFGNTHMQGFGPSNAGLIWMSLWQVKLILELPKLINATSMAAQAPKQCATALRITSRERHGVMSLPFPRCSMYGIFTYIWYIFMLNVGKYTIH